MIMSEGRQRDLQKGMSGEDVKWWQQFLTEQEFDPGAITGVFNTQTHLATVTYQTAHGLPGTGIVDSTTRALRSVSGRS
jgi:peptidoglycan hydrolase-like protein with peptidoglycan-binding domain